MSSIFVQIALPVPTPWLFTYRVPEIILEQYQSVSLVGFRALVPFGKRIITGVIVQDENVEPIPNVKDILEILDVEPVFSLSMLTFARWVADYYMASLGETLKAALPQGMTVESIIRVSAIRTPDEAELREMERRAPRRAELLRELLRHSGDISVGYLEKLLKSNTHLTVQLETLEQLGYIERHRALAKEIQPKRLQAVTIKPELLKDEDQLRAALNELDNHSPKQALALSHIYLHTIKHTTPLLVRDLTRTLKISSAALKALVQKNLVVEYQAEVFRTETTSDMENSETSLIQKDERELSLTIEQQHAVEKVLEALQQSAFKTFLLHGVTGSGKTLVYIHIIKAALSAGKTALLLVPEISLTPQLIERFRSVFGDRVGVMHSHKSAGERYDAWRMAKSGMIDIIIGARSAIFAPLNNLGVIIIDEEHEPSYKQDSPAPRYHARDCAIVRGMMEHAAVVLGSATPSLESMFNAHNGKYHLLQIRERADGAEMPVIRVVDLLAQRKRRQMYGSFSRVMLDTIADRLRKKEGIILFQNRRGFASRFECLDCGTIPMCQNCSVPLTYHKYREQLRCHYCGYSRPAEKACQTCGSLSMKEIGSGTQRIEDELTAALEQTATTPPDSPASGEQVRSTPVIQRMDLDTTSKRGAHRKMLMNFASGAVDILLGTQMVAKGLDFARVTLVGVVNADIQLYVPDFRAAERTFQLITQVAGRAGRSSQHKGEVIIQTSHPRHQTIMAAVAHNYELFYHDELQFRKEANYPPFSRFILIELSGRNEQQVHEQAQHFAFLVPHHHRAFHVLGPAVPTIARLRTMYRRIIVIKGNKEHDPTGKIVRDYIQQTHATYNQRHASSAVQVTIDIDASGTV